jgi:hypothetical protein
VAPSGESDQHVILEITPLVSIPTLGISQLQDEPSRLPPVRVNRSPDDGRALEKILDTLRASRVRAPRRSSERTTAEWRMTNARRTSASASS